LGALWVGETESRRNNVTLTAINKVDVWRLSLDLFAESLERCEAVISSSERERGERFLSPQHRRRYLASQGQLRWLLARYLNRPPRSLKFSRHQWGKPYLADADLSFNISHSQDCLLIAVTQKQSIGVDVEALHPLHSMEAMARRCFADSELAYWEGLAEDERPKVFFRLWTLKEALVKAIGRGLGLGVKRCVYGLAPLRLLALPEECGSVDNWRVCELDVGSDFRAALCVSGGKIQVVRRNLPLDWLLTPEAAAGHGIEDWSGAFQFPQAAGNDQ